MSARRAEAPADEAIGDARGRVVTVPNALTVLRLIGIGVLLVLAGTGHPRGFLWLFAVLMLTDWLDGKLAILLHQRTALGARLDSVADVLLYAAVVACLWWLKPEFIRIELPLLVGMASCYALTVVVAVVKFRRLPAYHTRIAKTCWFLVGLGIFVLFLHGSHWPARIALIAAIVANLETTAISLVLPEWCTNVPSLYHARRRMAASSTSR